MVVAVVMQQQRVNALVSRLILPSLCILLGTYYLPALSVRSSVLSLSLSLLHQRTQSLTHSPPFLPSLTPGSNREFPILPVFFSRFHRQFQILLSTTAPFTITPFTTTQPPPLNHCSHDVVPTQR